MILAFSVGLYCGIAISIGIWYYLAEDPFEPDKRRLFKTVESIVVGIGWGPIVGGIIVPMFTKELARSLRKRIRSLRND